MMKKYFLFFVVPLMMMAACSNAQKEDKIALGFYNLENLFDTIDNPNVRDTEFTPKGDKEWDSRRYETKLKNMAQTISRIGTDKDGRGLAVVGICEVENRGVVEDLVAEESLRGRDYQIIHHDSPDARGIDCALLYQADLFEPTATKVYPLVMDDLLDFESRDQLLVSGLLQGEKVHVLVNHWPSRYGGTEKTIPMRAAAARLAKHISDSLRSINPDAKILIMGDLNDDPQDASVYEILGAKESKEKAGENGFYNPMNLMHKNGDGTLTYRGKWNLFDQIVLSPGLFNGTEGWQLQGAYVYRDKDIIVQEGKYKDHPLRTFGGKKYLAGYSDHLPVYVVLEQ